MQQLYFVRHGESELNLTHTFAGQTDTPLTARGRQQAVAAGEQAKALQVDLIVSSSLSRALETAQIIATAIGYSLDKIIVNPIFMERSLGSLEGQSWDEVDEDASDATGVETEDELLIRAQAGLEFLRGLSASTVLLVGHGSYSRALRTAIDPTHNYPEPENAEIVRLLP